MNDILSLILLYVNPKKATDTLMYSLNIILDNLQREYTQAIVSDTFAISIPSDEIAYLAEIFLHTE